MLRKIEKSEKGVISIEYLNGFSETTRKEAFEKFEYYMKKNVVKSSYDDAVWRCNNQKQVVNIDFGYRFDELKDVCQSKKINVDRVIDCMKQYTTLRMGGTLLENIRDEIKYFISEIIKSDFCTRLVKPSEVSHGRPLRYYYDFLMMYGGISESYLKLCDDVIIANNAKEIEKRKGTKHPCKLNEMMSYFSLDVIVRDFLKKNKNSVARDYFMPLLLFWITTSILPQRVTEFCLMPINCVRKDGNSYYIRIRRSRLKGSSAELVKYQGYKIDTDYYVQEYEIPKWLYDLYMEYYAKSKKYKHPYNLLFSVDYMLSLGYGKNHTKSTDKVFSPLELGEIKDLFYTKVICGEYNYSLVDEEQLMTRFMEKDGSYEMNDNEIMMIHCKHTRHLALINLLYRGCNPMMLKEFSGHESEAMAFHYANNISKAARCITKVYYERAKKANIEDVVSADYNPTSILIDESLPHVELDKGWCYSEKLMKGDESDCKKCNGNCETCALYKPKKKSIDLRKDEIQMDSEMDSIRELLKSEKIKEKIEEYCLRTNRLENLIRQYSLKVWKELEDKDHGKEI